MSSKAGKIKKDTVQRRIETVVQVLSIMEEEASKKSFLERFKICCQYLFLKRFDAFFRTKKKKG